MEPVIVVERPAQFDELMAELANAPYISIDTESNSFYAYFERVCLIQISTEQQDYIVDPLTVPDMKALGEILEDPGCEKIFHAAPNDVLGLKRDYGFKICNIFDTAIAAKLLGYKHLGLAKILEEHFGVYLNKKWQRYDWGKRPLQAEHFNYARLDTHYLIPLRHRLAADLHDNELWEPASEAFQKACEQEAQTKSFQPEGFIQIHGAKSLDQAGRRVLKALYTYREHEARKRNRAPFRILSNETLFRLACARPKNVQDFTEIKGLPRSYQRSHAAHSLLDLIRKTENLADDQ
jgi:ribonuclease D